MSDLTNERIAQLGMTACAIDEGDSVHLDAAFFKDVFDAMAELHARRRLSDERKTFWAKRGNHDTPPDCSGTA